MKKGDLIVGFTNGTILAVGPVTRVGRDSFDVLDLKTRRHEEVYRDEAVAWARFGQLLTEDLTTPGTGETYTAAWRTYWKEV